MVKEVKQMKGEELVRKILEGERDFSRLRLEEGFDLSGHESFEEIQEYLKGQDFKKDPVIINDSEFRYIKAKGLYFPFVKGEGAKLNYADFENANFENANFFCADLDNANLQNVNLNEAKLWSADFKYANLSNIKLRGAYLENANLSYADLSYADLRKAYLRWTDFWNTDLRNTDFRGIRNVGEATHLEFANFLETRVTPREKAIIDHILSKRKFRVLK